MNDVLRNAITREMRQNNVVKKQLNKLSNKALEEYLVEINDKILDYEGMIAGYLGVSQVVQSLLSEEDRKRTKWQKFWYGK